MERKNISTRRVLSQGLRWYLTLHLAGNCNFRNYHQTIVPPHSYRERVCVFTVRNTGHAEGGSSLDTGWWEELGAGGTGALTGGAGAAGAGPGYVGVTGFGKPYDLPDTSYSCEVYLQPGLAARICTSGGWRVKVYCPLGAVFGLVWSPRVELFGAQWYYLVCYSLSRFWKQLLIINITNHIMRCYRGCVWHCLKQCHVVIMRCRGAHQFEINKNAELFALIHSCCSFQCLVLLLRHGVTWGLRGSNKYSIGRITQLKWSHRCHYRAAHHKHSANRSRRYLFLQI